MRPMIILAFVLAACGSAPGETGQGGPDRTPTAWPEDFEVWVCDALHELESDAVPATEDMTEAFESSDAERLAEAAERAEDSAVSARGMLDLAPVWRPGSAVVEDLYRSTELFAQGSDLVAAGVGESGDPGAIETGKALIADGLAAMAEADAEMTTLRAETGFTC